MFCFCLGSWIGNACCLIHKHENRQREAVALIFKKSPKRAPMNFNVISPTVDAKGVFKKHCIIYVNISRKVLNGYNV